MTILGSEAISIYNNCILSQIEQNEITISEILSFKEKYFIRIINFQQKIMQDQNETFDKFFTRTPVQTKMCEFKELHYDLLKDRIMFGFIEKQLR